MRCLILSRNLTELSCVCSWCVIVHICDLSFDLILFFIFNPPVSSCFQFHFVLLLIFLSFFLVIFHLALWSSSFLSLNPSLFSLSPLSLSVGSSLWQRLSTPSPNKKRREKVKWMDGVNRGTGSRRLPWATSTALAEQQRSSVAGERAGRGGVRTEMFLKGFMIQQQTQH